MRFPARRSTAGFLLANYILLLTGIPLPVPVAKDIARPFPCQQHQCGCRSAEQCWRSCCCLSHEQKLAWAREHGVTPPTEASAVAQHAAPRGKSSCCQKQVRHAQVAHRADSSHGTSCCDTHSTPESEGTTLDFVLTIRALGCQGEPGSWVAANPAVMPVAPKLFGADTVLVERYAPRDILLSSVSLTFDPPPPRA